MKLKINNTEGIRETNKTKNRQLIIEAGIKVFINKGVAEATVRDIIRSTGLASGTFYNYFKSKEEVLVAIFDDFALEIGKNIRVDAKKPNKIVRSIIAITATGLSIDVLIKKFIKNIGY